MTDEQPTERLDAIGSDDRPDGPDRSGRSAGRRRALTAAAAALALVAAGAVGATLVTGSDPLEELLPAASATSPDPTATADKEIFRHRGGGPWLGHGHGLGHGLGPRHGFGLGGAPLHGELVVPDPDGDGYRTVTTQRGEVTAASDTSLTVRSEDGFSATYRLTEDTVYLGGVDGASALEDGTQVHVAGVREGGAVRAVHVADLSRVEERLGEMRDRFRDRFGDRARETAPDPT